MKLQGKFMLGMALLNALSGCAYVQHKGAIDVRGSTTEEQNRQLQAGMLRGTPLVQKAKGAWLGSRATELGADAVLPGLFNTSITMRFQGSANLRTIAERLGKVTGMPVRLKSDVFQSSGSAGSATAAPANESAAKQPGNLPPPPPINSSPMFSMPGNGNADDMEVNYSGPLKQFLDQVATRFGVNWEYANGTVQFYRLVSKTFRLKANPGNSTVNAALGKSSGSSGSGASGSFTSTGQVNMEASYSVWDGLQKALDAIKTPAGKIFISQATGTVVMTDTLEAVEAAGKLIDSENELLTRQVAISVEMLSVSKSDDRELGVDWGLVYQRLTNLIPHWRVTMQTPASLISTGAGSVGLGIIAPASDDSRTSRLTGSQAMLKALQGVGRVNILNTMTALTLNRQPAPFASTNQLSYLARTTPGSTGSSGGSALPGLEPGTVTTGFIASMLPTVLDNNSILLQFSIDSSELRRLGIISSGQGSSEQSIQTPEVSSVSMVQRVAVRPGATIVLTGFERETDLYDQSTLAGQVGLGGSYAGKRKRESIVILVTPMLVKGG